MTNKNDHIQHLLSHYCDSELSAEQRQLVDEHSVKCEPCRDLLMRQRQADSLMTSYVATQREHLTTQELIGYHEGTIKSPWRRNAIESHLASCVECGKILDVVQQLDEVVVETPKENEPATERLKGPYHRLFNSIFGKRLIPAGAVMAAIVLLIILVISQRSNPYESLVQITPAQYLPTEMRGEEAASSAFEKFRQGMERYLANDFTGAVTLLQEAAAEDEMNPQFQFFCGVTLLLTRQYEKGLTYLTKNPVLESAYRDETRWYAAQAFLMLNRPEPARRHLAEPAESSGAFSAKAAGLLNQINAIKRR